MSFPVRNFSLSRPLPGESAPACWERLADFNRWPSWNSEFRKINCVPAGEAGRGGVFEIETAAGRKLEWTIVHWEPQFKLAFIMQDQFHRCAWCFEFPADSAPEERGLNLSLELQCKRRAALLGWWLRWRELRRANRFLDCLSRE